MYMYDQGEYSGMEKVTFAVDLSILVRDGGGVQLLVAESTVETRLVPGLRGRERRRLAKGKKHISTDGGREASEIAILTTYMYIPQHNFMVLVYGAEKVNSLDCKTSA